MTSGAAARTPSTSCDRSVASARSNVAFLAAAVQQRHGRRVAAQQQRACPGRAAELVPRHGQRVGTRSGEVDRQRPDRLHGVGVERDAVLVRDLGELAHRLDRAHLVVGPHHADQRDVVGECITQRSASDQAGVVHLEPGDLRPLVRGQPAGGVEDGVVLDGAQDDPPTPRIGVAACPEQALQRQVVGLRAAGGEDDLRRPRAQRGGELFARFLDSAPGVTARSVQ